MDKSLVTVITPVYNGEKYIKQTINSILMQQLTLIQYIVIDDGSTDLTGHILDSFGDRITAIHQTNQGENYAVNVGLSTVKGKYFMIVNADDPLWSPTAVNRMCQFMETHPDTLVAYPNWVSIDDQGKERAHFNLGEYDFKHIVSHHTCQPSVGSIYRSTVIKTVGYRDHRFGLVSDFDYFLRIGLAGKMAHVDKELAAFRIHGGQQSGVKSEKRAKWHIQVIENFYLKERMSEEIKAVKSEARAWAYIVAASVTDSKSQMMRYLGSAFTIYPALILKFGFWDILVKRTISILRR
jgi:glycosyltransferase involved in cell wall biosynthesis